MAERERLQALDVAVAEVVVVVQVGAAETGSRDGDLEFGRGGGKECARFLVEIVRTVVFLEGARGRLWEACMKLGKERGVGVRF